MPDSGSGQTTSRGARIVIACVILAAVAAGTAVVLRHDWSASGGSGLGNEFKYNISGYTKTDPALVKYRKTAEIKTGLAEPLGLAVGPGDRIYVAGDKAIRIFDREGKPAGEIKADAAPRAVAVAEDGAVFAAMREHVEVFGPDGIVRAKWESLGSRAMLTSVVAHGDNVFVADAVNRVVVRYSKAGKLLNRIGQKDEARNAPGFIVPSPNFDVLVASDGLLRVVDPGRHVIDAFTFDGELEFSWGKSSMEMDGFSGCCNPVNVCLLPDGRIVTVEKGIPRAKVYREVRKGEEMTGAIEAVVAGPEHLPDEHADSRTVGDFPPIGPDVAADSQGRVLILLPSRKAVWVFSPNALAAPPVSAPTAVPVAQPQTGASQ